MVVRNDKKIVMLGVEDILAIETDDTIYIVNKGYMDNLRNYQNQIS